MDREIELLQYLPPVLQEIKEYQILTRAEKQDINELSAAIKQLKDDQFVSTSTLVGVQRREKLMRITPKGTDTLDERKFRILVRMNEQLPNTLRTLARQLINLCGEDGYSLVLDHNNYILKVRIALTAKSNFQAVENLLDRVVPANLIIDLSLKYNQYSALSKFTHGQLSNYTHEQLRNEVFN
ncbi:putative phage tail protein [Peribacillus loiseleuriae]|uniref:Phage portal protein n=1 Tax=Peribacillus loiseleuriae TaxID=1679170 RepID=A0A0K9GRI4_9BACI|nr:putative phage tail protein [Peribacillus loiseleuriae]KMY49243.1 hypothetical protein AC625_06670 [Peribacillus loiseleuriae]